MPLLGQVGFSATVPDAVDEVKAVVHYVTRRPGGDGAVRELCDLLRAHRPRWPAHPLVALLGKPKKRVIGLMSGTSLDGIDAALVDIDGFGADARVSLVDFRTTPYSPAERDRIHTLFTGDASSLCQGNFMIGALFSDAALAVAQGHAVDLIGSHGQTVWHQPPSMTAPGGIASTLQLGEPALIAARTGVVTVGDFRVADMAHGGEGAPLFPFADWLLFRAPGRVRALQNIGGIANVARVSDDRDATVAFDNGPGNVMVDALMPAASNGAETIDRGGAWSARGTVQEDSRRRAHARRLPRPAAAEVDRPRALRQTLDAGLGRAPRRSRAD